MIGHPLWSESANPGQIGSLIRSDPEPRFYWVVGGFYRLLSQSRNDSTYSRTGTMNRIDVKPRCTPALLTLVFLTLAGVLMSCAPSSPAPERYPRIVVLGDSLSDIGNLHSLTGGALPTPPHAAGRFCNGPLWIEYLAEHLGIELLPDDNYAVGGATTGSYNVNNGEVDHQKYPGLQQQIEAFLTAGGPDAVDPKVHPTTRGHEVLAGAAREHLADQFTSRPGAQRHAQVSDPIAPGIALSMVGGSEPMADQRPDEREPELKGHMKRMDVRQSPGRLLGLAAHGESRGGLRVCQRD
jgi:hypothetical protein